VECHQRRETINALPASYEDQFVHWYESVHGRKGITCEKCHGGEPSRSEKEQAHRGMKSSRDPQSLIYYKNLPETCGKCHQGVYQQFVRSRHYQNLKTDRLAPTCTTCHGFEMDIRGVAPNQIVGRCMICHNTQQRVKPEVSSLGRAAVEEIAQAEDAIRTAQMAVGAAREQGRAPTGPALLLDRAQDRLKKTGNLWHSFRLDAFKLELMEIQKMARKASSDAEAMLVK
jgi:cytochrome c7-like protein